MALIWGTTFDWTDERLALLKQRWADGLSASQIAGELGGGVTRSAVCGKVFRLGLSGRSATVTIKPRAPKANPRPGRPITIKPRPPAQPKYAAPKPATDDDTEVDTGFQSDGITDIVEDTDIPVEQRKTLLELTDTTCRWPIGEPTSPDFYFCGGAAATRIDGKPMPYCSNHCQRAFGVAAPRREMSDAERAQRAMQMRKNLQAHKQALAAGER